MHTQEYLQLARDGDDRAYDELFARVAPRVLLYIRLRLGKKLATRLEAEDVLQETFLEAHRSFTSFRSANPSAFVGWLCRIADHRLGDLADHFGAKKRSAPRAEARFSEILGRLGYSGTGPSTAFAREETKERVAEAMDQVSDDARQALLLRHFHGHTQAEIADLMGKSEAAVRRLLLRAHMKLGHLLRALAEPNAP